MKKKNYTAKELAFEITNNIGSLGCLLENLEHVRKVLSHIAVDAKDKYAGNLQQYFLFDNHDALQTVDNLMWRLLKEMQEEHKQIEEMQKQLRELIKVEELDQQKSPILAATSNAPRNNTINNSIV